MALAATILKNDPVAFSAALETAPIDELRAVHRALHKTLYGESPPVKVQVGFCMHTYTYVKVPVHILQNWSALNFLQAPPTTKQVDLVEAWKNFFYFMCSTASVLYAPKGSWSLEVQTSHNPLPTKPVILVVCLG